MIIKIILSFFVLFVILRIAYRFYKNEISRREMLIWLVFWLTVGGAIVLPQSTDLLAAEVGVERGADLLVYISVLVLFYLVFRILVKLEKVDRDITKVTRHIALEEEGDKEIKRYPPATPAA